MKKTILICSILLTTAFLYGQEIKISVAPTINNALYFKFVAGGPGRNFKPGFSTSLDYSFIRDKKINLGFGLAYHFSQVEYTPNMNTGDLIRQTDKLKLISVSFATIYNLNRLYLSLNPMLDFQLNKNADQITDKQMGLGISFSIGKHFEISDNLKLNLEPKLWIHNIIPFNSEFGSLKLTTAGLNVGLVF
ncbi:MAG: hypothetical protein WAL29_11185 [Bacteroidales bacterium]